MKMLTSAAIRCSLIFLVPTVTYAISAQWDLDGVLGARQTLCSLDRMDCRRLSWMRSSTVQPVRSASLLSFSSCSDSVGAKAAAEQARDTLEQLYRDQPDSDSVAAALSLAYAAMGEKDLALRTAERATVLLPSAKDRLYGPGHQEILAFVQTVVGENSRAISSLAQLLQTPYFGRIYSEAPITPALLRLDPIWDPLRADPAFQKLCEEKQP